MLRARRTTHVSESDDRRRRGRKSETGRQSSAKHDGASPVNHWKQSWTVRAVAPATSGVVTRSVWWDNWSQRRAPVTSRAAAFWADCGRRISPSATPYSRKLQ